MNRPGLERLRVPMRGQLRWGNLRAMLPFLVQIPFVVGYSTGRIPIHPIVVMLPLVGVLNSKIEKRGRGGLGLAVVRPLRSLLLALLYATLSLAGLLMALDVDGGTIHSADPVPHLAMTIVESFLVGVFIIAVWEEVLNRGYIQTRLQAAWGLWGIVVTALLFASMHIPSALLDYGHDWMKAGLRFAHSAVAGLALGYVYWHAQSVLTTIAIHGLSNFVAGIFPLLTGFAAQEMIFAQPAVQLLWLVGQAGLTVLLARAFFDGNCEQKAISPERP